MNTFLDFSRRYVWRYAWWYGLGFLFIVGTQGLAVAIIEETKVGIDAMMVPGATARTILPFALHIVAFAVLLVIIRTMSRLLIFTPGRMIEYRIRNDYYANLMFLQRDFLAKHESGDLVSRCSNDIGHIRAAYGFGLLQVANVSVTLSLVTTAMLRMDFQTTMYLAIPMVVAFGLIQFSIRYLFSFWRRANRQLGALSTLCLASYKGVAAIQNYHAEPAVDQRFVKVNQDYLDTVTVIARTRSFMNPLIKLVEHVSMFMVLWLVGPKVIGGQLSVGQVTAFLGYISMIMPPLLSLGWMMNVFSQAVPAMERLDEILLAKSKPLGPQAEAQIRAVPAKGLVARKLGFRFPGDDDSPFSLRDIEFQLPPGKVLGLVGPLGSGKSVLLETILRLNHLNPGQLYLNGRDAAYMPLKDYRDHFSFTPQKALLFSTTLRQNLMMALPVEDWNRPDVEERLEQALACAGFHLDPKLFPKGLETQVGEKGVMLSGGQRQRMALARALLKDADIYVFDDVLSAVDHETEKTIIANIRAFAPGKSFIIASHRISAIQWADEVLVLQGGRVAARGSHQALIGQPGFYRDIYRYQSEHGEEAS